MVPGTKVPAIWINLLLILIPLLSLLKNQTGPLSTLGVAGLY